jgi:hypothetical protein
MNPMTLEQFRASRSEVPDLSAVISDHGGDLEGERGFVYAGNVYMRIYDKSEAQPERNVGLVLDGWDWLKPESQLSELEEQLYEWALSVGALDGEQTSMQTDRGPLRRLSCYMCGAPAGEWHQHSARDYGCGVCVRCVTAKRLDGKSEADILSACGEQGVNWGLRTIVFGQIFQVVAAFAEYEHELIRTWLQTHPTQWYVDSQDGLALITDIPRAPILSPARPTERIE